MAETFEYVSSPPSGKDQEHFVLRIPAGIRTKTDLLKALADQGRFPDYFGDNWDALLDCLRDLSWIGNRKVIIAHSDVPLQNLPSECRTYLEILEVARADWLQVERPNNAEPPPEWSHVEHELRVLFPSETRAFIAKLLRCDSGTL